MSGDVLADLLDEESEHDLVLRLAQKKKGARRNSINRKMAFVVAIIIARTSEGVKKEAAIEEACKKCGVSRATAFKMFKHYQDLMEGWESYERQLVQHKG